jgi:hypothetical protein
MTIRMIGARRGGLGLVFIALLTRCGSSSEDNDVAGAGGQQPTDGSVQPSDGARPDGARPDNASPDGASPDGASPDRVRPDGGNSCKLPDGSKADPQYGAEGNPTGDPIGGGPGYRDIKSSADADFVVQTKDGLRNALSNATSGQIIYVDDAAQIDLTGETRLEIPLGVTLASGRGRGGSQGALLFTLPFGSKEAPLLVAGGDHVRLTGIRVRGPDPEIGDKATNVNPAQAIQTSYPYLEVDNCEIWAWYHSGVVVDKGGTNIRIHHNHIHHNRRDDLGYGLKLEFPDEAAPIDALIEANLFDFCRHSIASSGNAFGSYEARYNIALEHANASTFDRHGTGDPGNWFGGVGGDSTLVHHNTVRQIFDYAVGIRGVPVKTAEVYRNWFYQSDPARAFYLFEGDQHPDKILVHDNALGPMAPDGTYLPLAKPVATPPGGRAPLTVAFDATDSCDPVGTIVSYAWDFGDGQVGSGARADHVYATAGRYLATLTVTNNLGIPVSTILPVVVVPPPPGYELNFWVKDSYRGNLTGYYALQALIDDTVVWEADVAGDKDWEHVQRDVSAAVAGKSEVTIKLRAVATRAVTDPNTQISQITTYWDDVMLFGSRMSNGDFEAGAWAFDGTTDPWYGTAQSGEAHTGSVAQLIAHKEQPSVQGSYGEAIQRLSMQ